MHRDGHATVTFAGERLQLAAVNAVARSGYRSKSGNRMFFIAGWPVMATPPMAAIEVTRPDLGVSNL